MSSRPEKFGTAVFKRIPIGCCKEGVIGQNPSLEDSLRVSASCLGIRKAAGLSR